MTRPRITATKQELFNAIVSFRTSAIYWQARHCGCHPTLLGCHNQSFRLTKSQYLKHPKPKARKRRKAKP